MEITFVNNLSSSMLLFLSAIISVGIGIVAYKVFMSKIGTPERLLIWYAVLAGAVLSWKVVVCSIQEPSDNDFQMCSSGIAPWFTLIAAHTLIFLLFINHKDNKKPTLPMWADLLGSFLIFVAAYFYFLPAHILVLSPAIALITVPLMTIICEHDQERNTNRKITCCNCCQ